MLQKLRDKTTGWIASLILGLLIIPFAFVGVNEYMTGGTDSDVAVVEAPPTWWASAPQWWPVSMLWQREEVTVEEFRAAIEQARQQQRQAQGEAFDSRQFESIESKRAILEQLVDRKVLALASTRAGIRIGDAAVQKAIASEPAFQVDGKFSPEQYQLLLSSQVPPITPTQFDEQQRERLRMLLIPQAINDSDFFTIAEQERMWKLFGETRDISLALLPAIPEDTTPVSDADIKAWYDTHKNDFKQAESVALEYVEINGATLPVNAPIDEAALRKRYEAEKSRFIAPEQRVVAHILIAADASADAATQKAAEQKAIELTQQAKGGADFAALARANSADPGSKDSGGELPPFAKDGSMVKPFEDAAFAMQAGEIRGPVRSDFGYHVLQLREIKPGAGRTFEQVRDELAAEQAGSERERAYSDLAGRVVNETLKNPTALGPAAQAVGLPLQTLPLFPRNAPAGIAAVPAVLRAAFSETLVQDGTISDPIEIAPNHSVVIRVTQHVPEQAQPLAKARDAVIAAIRSDRRNKAAEAAADALVARVAKGEALSAVAAASDLRYNELPGMRRGVPMPTAEANEAIFAAKRPAAGKVTPGKVSLGDGNYIVFTINKVTDGDMKAVPEEERATMKQQLAQMSGGVASQAYVDAMRKQFKVKVFEERF